MIKNISGKTVVLFDGACGFCNASVNFIIRHERKDDFLFVPLQTEHGVELLKSFNCSAKHLRSLVIIENKNIYFKSTAALRIAGKLKPPVRWLSIFLFIPENLRDKIYNWIAVHRYKLPGSAKSCVYPDETLKRKFQLK
jgi:predicted DCC family thiol-disulfide oxidoreductase YuxK